MDVFALDLEILSLGEMEFPMRLGHLLKYAVPGVLASLLQISGLNAADWPQILGPNRNGIADGEKVMSEFPKGGPKSLWHAEIGSGFAGVAVSGDRVVVFHRRNDQDLLTAYDAKTGQEIWSQAFHTSFQPSIVDDDGPRSVPTIHQGRVYALAAAGGLYCVDLKSGKPVWERQTQKDFRIPQSYFGAGTSPLVEGKTLIVNVGGDKDDAGIVAFDLDDGSTVWKSTREQASYSSPIALTIDNTRHLLCITRLNLVSLDPATGTERFRTPFGKRGPTVNAAIPVLIKDKLLVTASYEIGAELLSVRADTVEVDWSDEILSSQYTTPIFHQQAIYGIDGRQDGGPVTLKCFDPLTRKIHWSKPVGYATLIAADGKLLVMQTSGVLKLVELTTAGYRELGSASLLTGVTRALPAFSNGRFYVRNESRLKCVSLAP